MRIWKYTLSLTDTQTINMPHGAHLLAVQMQHGTPQLWALCDENSIYEPRNIAIYGTGNPIPNEPGKYIDTFQMDVGALVFHVFDISG